MKKALVLFLILASSHISAHAEEDKLMNIDGTSVESTKQLPVIKKNQRHYLLSVGYEQITEQGEDQVSHERQMPQFALGFGWNDFLYSLEYSYFSTNTGNAALSVKRDFAKLSALVRWQFMTEKKFAPYLVGGAGVYQQKITTHLGGQDYVDQSNLQKSLLLGLGARLVISSIWLSTELRLFDAEKWTPNPSYDFVTSLGYYF